MKRECVIITEDDLKDMSPRCYKMISWIFENQKDIDWQDNGNITFNFNTSTLKVETKKYTQL